MYFKFADTAERLITTNFVDIIGTGDFNTKKYWDGPWTKVSCGWSEDGMNMIFHMSKIGDFMACVSCTVEGKQSY